MSGRSPASPQSRDGSAAAGTEDGADRDATASADGAGSDSGADGPLSGRAGWAFAALLAVSFVGFPVAILLWPPTFVPFRDAYLALSLVPGFLLGAAGVWTALRDRRRRAGR